MVGKRSAEFGDAHGEVLAVACVELELPIRLFLWFQCVQNMSSFFNFFVFFSWQKQGGAT